MRIHLQPSSYPPTMMHHTPRHTSSQSNLCPTADWQPRHFKLHANHTDILAAAYRAAPVPTYHSTTLTGDCCQQKDMYKNLSAPYPFTNTYRGHLHKHLPLLPASQPASQPYPFRNTIVAAAAAERLSLLWCLVGLLLLQASCCCYRHPAAPFKHNNFYY